MFQNSYIIGKMSLFTFKNIQSFIFWTLILSDAISSSICFLGNLRYSEHAKQYNKKKGKILEINLREEFFILSRWIGISFGKPVQVLSI